ncbi:pentatricopeptide repeat-containing protein-like [Dorcoceras hygrometricum]|uniref:Pentatricopeptide repeat-containing protein-like n=1 Tax=Dorcoceras hygrometricum TaxID=472368 RepID=A0A2Z7D6U3_9LAMI|nr:pentatricopeptide repeat-containing protein-like [Dorcoceras hygrometricum]
MHENKATTKVGEPKDLKKQLNNRYPINWKIVATRCVSIWELPTRLNTRYQMQNTSLNLCCIRPVVTAVLILPGCEGERQYRTLISLLIDSDLVIYRTTLVRTFQVVTICRVDKSESTRSVLGKWVYLVPLAMSLFDLLDVCIAIGSLATLDLPMVVDLIGIYVMKGPYCTLTTTNWFLQELSVIPRGSWSDVDRRFTMIRWARLDHNKKDHNLNLASIDHSAAPLLSPPLSVTPPPKCRRPAAAYVDRTCSDQLDEEFSSVLNSLKCRFPRETGRIQAPRRQQESKQVTQWLLTRTIEPSWLRTNQLELKKTSSEKRKPDREIWSSFMLMREMDARAYDREQCRRLLCREDHMPSDTKGIMEEDSCGEISNQLGRKPDGK